MINLLNFQKKSQYQDENGNQQNQGKSLHGKKLSKLQKPPSSKKSESQPRLSQVKLISLNEENNGFDHQKIAIQNIPNPHAFSNIDLPTSIIKPLRPKFERVASAHYHSQIIKKIQGKQAEEFNINNQLLKNNYFQEQHDSMPFLSAQPDLAVSQAKKFFNENYIKPSTAGQINRKNYKKSNIYQSNLQDNQMILQKQQQRQEEEFLQELEMKDQEIKDFREMAEHQNRAKTAGLINQRMSDSNQELYKVTGNGIYINRVNLEDQGEEYETFKINRDVRSHMTKFLRPASQYALNGKKKNTLSPRKYLGKTVYQKLVQQQSGNQYADDNLQMSQSCNNNNSNKRISKTAQQQKRRSTNNFVDQELEKRPFTQQHSGSRSKLKSLQDDNLEQSEQKQKRNSFLASTQPVIIGSNSKQNQRPPLPQKYKKDSFSQKASQFDDQNIDFPSQDIFYDGYQGQNTLAEEQLQQQQKFYKLSTFDQEKKTKQVGSVMFDVNIKKGIPGKKSQQTKIGEKKQREKEKNNNVGFDFEFEGITQDEFNYINKQKQEIEKFELKYGIEEIESLENKKKSQKEQLEADITDKKQQNVFQDNEIKQDTVDIGKKHTEFFSNDNNIREELIQLGDQFVDKFKQYVKEDEKMFQEMEEDKLHQLDFLQADGKYLSDYEIDFITQEYMKDVNQRDYNALDTMCSKLKFFTQFTRPTRIYLLKLANITNYPPNVNIFEQGDEGDLMYIIIKGGCHVRIKRTNINGEIENPVFVTLYDGAQFGELALQAANKAPKGLFATLMGEEQKVKSLQDVQNIMEQDRREKEEEERIRRKKMREQRDEDSDEKEDIKQLMQKAENAKRAATIQTCESTMLFTISRDQYKNIIVNMMKKDLDDKLQLLQTLSFFDFFSSVSLMTLAKHIEVQKFKLGEIILKESTPPNHFYLISKGRVKILKEEMFIRKNKLLGMERNSMKKRFNYGKIDYKDVTKGNNPYLKHEIQKFDDYDEQNDDEYVDNQTEQIKMKADHYKMIYQNDDKCMFKYQFDFGTMARSDFFMGRSLISEYLKLHPKYSSEIQNKDVHMPARLTIVADSAETEIYRIDKMKIYELPVFLRKVFIDGLNQKKEYDWEYDNTYKLDVEDLKKKKPEKISFNQYMFANFGQNWVREWERYKTDLVKQSKIDFVVNLASETRYGFSTEHYKEKTVMLSKHSSSFAAKYQVDKYIELSTANVYKNGAKNNREQLNNSNVDPVNKFSKFKLEAENCVRETNNLNWVIFRAAQIYGNYQEHGFIYRLMAGAIYKYLNEPYTILWDDKLKSQTVHVIDVCRAILYCLNKSNINKTIFNLVDQSENTQGKINSILTDLYGIKINSVGYLKSQIGRLRIESLLKEINEKHLLGWHNLCQAQQCHNSRLSLVLYKENVDNYNVSINGQSLIDKGFQYQYPQFTKQTVLDVIHHFIQQNQMPNNLNEPYNVVKQNEEQLQQQQYTKQE